MTLYYEAINRMPLADAVCLIFSWGCCRSKDVLPLIVWAPACNIRSLDVVTSIEGWH